MFVDSSRLMAQVCFAEFRMSRALIFRVILTARVKVVFPDILFCLDVLQHVCQLASLSCEIPLFIFLKYRSIKTQKMGQLSCLSKVIVILFFPCS